MLSFLCVYRYMIVSRNESDQHSLLVLDQNGDLVSEHPYSKGIITFSVGERIFHWSNHMCVCVHIIIFLCLCVFVCINVCE